MEQNCIENFYAARIHLPNYDNHKSAASKPAKKRVENICNCDIYVDDHHIFIYADVVLLKLHVKQQISVKDIKNLSIEYNPDERVLQLQLPCLPKIADEIVEKSSAQAANDEVNLWKLKCITDCCHLVLHNTREILHFEANFRYGFNSNYAGKIDCGESDMSLFRVPVPQLISPLKRSIDREIEELKNFSRDLYKCDFFELQVPKGLDNPMKYKFCYDDYKLEKDEELLLHNITRGEIVDYQNIDTAEIDCGLLNILMSICYDIRLTTNEPTCESGWTRSMLSAVLMYFEPFSNMKSTVISFLRRALIYPLYRNYDLARQCVVDTVMALNHANGRNWVLRQLLITHDLFASNDANRNILNHYYIEDYIRYVHGCCPLHLQIVAQNLKNILFDVFKNSLGLNLVAVETELLKDLMTNMRHAHGVTSEEDDDEDEEEESDLEDLDDDDDDAEDINSTAHSSSSDTEENSVIEQGFRVIKL